jgi:exosortase/archaeosortase family protein
MLTTPSPGSGCTHECNRFGVAVAADDVNGDGQADFIVGANAEIDKQGKVYVFSGADGTLLRTLDSPSPVETNEVLFGSTATAADVDADGKADIIVGAFRDDVDGVVEQGRAYLFFPSGLEVAVALEPDRRLRRSRTATVRATVTRAGVPQSCAAVAFSTTDPTVASVSPTSAVTDASGQTQASVHGESRGETTVTAVVDGASASAPVKVPDLSLIGVVLSVFCVMLFGSRAGLPLLRRSKTPERSMSATTQLNLRFATVMAVFAGVVFLTYREEVLGALLTPVATVTAEMTLVMLRWAGMVGVRVATVISHPDGFAYEIYYRCTGFLPVAFVTLAILASPGPLRRKVIGLALGVPVLIVLNLTRLVHLFYVGVHSPAAFDFAHAVVWEGLLILAIFALWLGWARWPDSRATSGVH